jgi:hypothetical protein
VRLHPAVVILVLILGGALGGVWGVLLAVPVAASIKIVAGHFWRTRVLGQSWEEATDALIVEPEHRDSLMKRVRRTGATTSAEDEEVPAASGQGGGEPVQDQPPLDG